MRNYTLALCFWIITLYTPWALAACPPFTILSPNSTQTMSTPSFATQIAGTAFSAYVFKLEEVTMGMTTTCEFSTFTGNQDIFFSFNYDNPSAGTLLPSVNGTAISATGTTNVNLSFNSGTATISIQYNDVGFISLNTQNDLIDSIFTQSIGFVPADFRITIPSNPVAASATDPKFVRAGEQFSVTVEALDANNNITPNFGLETTAESVSIHSAQLVLPLGGRNGTANDGTITNGSSFTLSAPGTFSGTTFAFDEVGIINLQAQIADSDYLGMGNVQSSLSENVGRFVPFNFRVDDTTDPIMNNTHFACVRTFNYIGEEISISTKALIEFSAVNSDGVVTANYDDDFFRFDPIINGIMTQNNPAVTLNASTTSPDGTNAFRITQTAAGVGEAEQTFDTTYAFELIEPITVPVYPFEAQMQLDLSLTDLDGVTTTTDPLSFGDIGMVNGGIDFDISKQIYHGRIIMDNALGSELLSLTIPVRLEIFDGLNFVTHTADNCTLLDDTTITINLTPTPVTLSSTITWAPGGFTDIMRFVNGQRSFSLSAPTSPGYFDIEMLLDDTYSWGVFKYDWPYDAAGIDGLVDDNPVARANFGLFPGDLGVIYRNEVFD